MFLEEKYKFLISIIALILAFYLFFSTNHFVDGDSYYYLNIISGKYENTDPNPIYSIIIEILPNNVHHLKLISIILVMAAFMWDTTYNQDLINTYKAIGWFISGVLIFSIAENAFIITKWGIFLKVREFIRSKIKSETQQDAEVTENIEKEHKRLLKGGKKKEASNEQI